MDAFTYPPARDCRRLWHARTRRVLRWAVKPQPPGAICREHPLVNGQLCILFGVPTFLPVFGQKTVCGWERAAPLSAKYYVIAGLNANGAVLASPSLSAEKARAP